MFDQTVIAAVRRPEDLALAVQARAGTVFLMYGEIGQIAATVAGLRAAGKAVFVHIDLIKGLSSDKEAVDFLVSQARPTGIVTTKGHLIKEIRKCGILAVHQLFVIDTQAYHSGIKNALASAPDAVEIMPALMPRIIGEMRQELPFPLVVAGLVKTPEEIRQLLDAGANAVAVGDSGLWNVHAPRSQP